MVRPRAVSHGVKEYDAFMAALIPRITVEPGKMASEPCIRGLRFTV